MNLDPKNSLENESNDDAAIELDAIFRALPDLLFCMDLNGKILSYKAGKPSSLFLLPEQFLGQQMQAILPPDVGKKFSQAFQKALQTGNVTVMDYQLQVQEGQRWFEAYLVPARELKMIAIIRDITDRVVSNEQTQRHMQRISAINSIHAAISSSFDLNVILLVILRQITGQLNVDAADILLLNQQSHMLEYTVGHGFRTMTFQPAAVMIGQGFAGTAALQRRTVSVPDLDGRHTGSLFSPGLAREKFASYYAIPLIAKGQVKGVLEIYHRSILQPSDDWFEFLSTMSGQTAIAIDSASLLHDLQKTNMELTMAYDAAIESWSRALELSGRENQEHTQHVVEWTMQLARAMHVDEKDLNDLRRGALLHDIGELVLPESILNKPGPLESAEWESIKRHPHQAYVLLSPIKHLAAALDIPCNHHERWDGSGYPAGLSADQIPLPARIFAVVDVYDALISARPYRHAWTKQAAQEYIREQSGKLFDPAVVNVFLQFIGNVGEGYLGGA
jgi:HD-GYP domain-containing protein (c-di-GMP phosphodiesterase class II)